MKDIDFDELDKAVNSLMSGSGGVPAATDKDEAAPVKVVNLDAAKTETPVAVPAPETTVITKEQTVVPVATSRVATPVPAERRSGRFMDMVHASSDMKGRTTSPPASREGITVAPRPEIATGIGGEEELPTPTTAIETMPDPINGVNATEDTSSQDSDETAGAPSGLSIPPAETPFLSDAKVEKRPLNPGGTTAVQPDQSEDEPDFESVTESVSEGRGADEPPAVPEIPELKPDLVAIEADPNLPATPAVEASEASKDVAEPAVPLGAASIAQQYVPQQSSGDQSHAAIYDASQYPEPIHHPAKKKAGWLWVVWVVLLLGVGAGGALVLYNLGIIP